jgi:thiamine transporter ThiT
VENSRQAFLRFGLSGVVSQSWGRGAVPQLARLTTLALTGTFIALVVRFVWRSNMYSQPVTKR